MIEIETGQGRREAAAGSSRGLQVPTPPVRLCQRNGKGSGEVRVPLTLHLNQCGTLDDVMTQLWVAMASMDLVRKGFRI